MSTLTSTEKKLHRSHLSALKKAYRERPIVLFTGAGVSMGNKGSPLEFPGWMGLIREVLVMCRPGRLPTRLDQFRKIKDPWKAADFVKKHCGARVQSTLRKIIQDRKRFPRPRRISGRRKASPNAKKQLGGDFLRNNTTLNAVVGFCGRLTGRTRQAPSAATIQFRGDSNPRVRAVLTANYDPFLEAASSSKFKIALLKPVAAYGSDAGNLRRIPVFHVHGYVPHPDQPRSHRRRKIPWNRQLVLDSASYCRAWDSTNAFGPTMVPQIHYLRHYVTVFIGFSFADRAVRRLLKTIRTEMRGGRDLKDRAHFAFVHADELRRRGLRFYASIGIRPIPFDRPSDVESALGDVYRAGLDQDHPGASVPIPWYAPRKTRPTTARPFRLSKVDYWKVLIDCRNTAVRRSTGRV